MSLQHQPDDLSIFAKIAICNTYQNAITSQKAVKKSRPVHEKTRRFRRSKDNRVEIRGNPNSTTMIFEVGIAFGVSIENP
jgi:hypothetical protein